MVTIKTAPRWIEWMIMSGNNTYYNGYNKIFEPNGWTDSNLFDANRNCVSISDYCANAFVAHTQTQPTDRPPVRPYSHSHAKHKANMLHSKRTVLMSIFAMWFIFLVGKIKQNKIIQCFKSFVARALLPNAYL